MEIVQIDFFEIEENDEYKKIIQKVVQTCFETEKLMNTNLYLNVILKEKNSEELLEKVFDNSKSNVGKVVSLQGMYRVNNMKYQKMKKKLRGKVNLFHGCYYVKEDAKRYLTGIEPYLESQTRMQD